MSQANFSLDAKTLGEIEELKKALGVKTTAEVLRKALALAKIATANSDSSNTLTILTGDPGQQQIKKILLND